MTTGLVTCSRLPDLHADDALLRQALALLGVETVAVDWEGPLPSGLDALLLRTPWNYHRQLSNFLAWVDATAPLPMHNSRKVVHWNCHKGYLAQLYDQGLPIVPTLTFEPGDNPESAQLEPWCQGRALVVKPAVSAGAYNTLRFDRWCPAAMDHLLDLLRDEAAIVQPYFSGIEQHGERSLIFIDGVFSHAVRRHLPLVEGPEVDYLMPVVAPTPTELKVARQILGSLPFTDLLYARVDLIPDPEGHPVLLELEVIEPQLFLCEYPPAATALAQAWAARVLRPESA